ncbi:Zn-dependent hydrolase [Oricola cellulosilytica]|uniref:Zn-dependent hydrolase n=1 Tax=Oricola cellulosilytica TaxID=1429082 RepID=A0A4R0P9Q8_9HYPH|nr:Zn-dependent hydrolase [Oricola cellulosilytica]TCD13675.1 Zn-dependent hydrolase [Oricola cellulosilytica]
MVQPTPAIDIDRLRRSLDGVNAFGFNAVTGGYNRVGYSDADMAARAWFADEMAGAGLRVSRDAVNNLFGRFGPADGPCIMAGSHLDTVPEGGAFDGSLGVCAAFECVRAMIDAGITPKTAIVVTATAEEEGRFGGMLGSQTITGAVTRDWIARASDSEGVALTAAMQAQGLDPFAAPDAAWRSGAIRAFLEMHIEQGPVLEQSGIPVGVAHGISGVCHLQIRFEGVANHSGTTPMDMRADAFAGLVTFAAGIPALIAELGTDQSRITVGKLNLEPNFAHTIPGTAEFSIIVRDTSEEVMRRLRTAAEARIADAAKAHGLTVSSEEKSWLPPVGLDSGLHALLRGEAERLGIACLDMPSGAGHDAQTMQSLCPSGLIFVPSRNGVSHAPEEWSDWAEIEKGASLMLAALTRLACE